MIKSRNELRNFLKKNSIDSPIGNLNNFDVIGEGGCGLVFSCKIGELEIAVKFLVENTTQKLSRFKSEYLCVTLLPANPYVCKLINLESIRVEGVEYPYILMKKYSSSLAKTRPNTPDEKSFKKLFDFLCDSLKFLHENGIVHRDLKPENILFDGNDYVLTDFGIASYDPEQFKIHPETQKGEKLGNHRFSAPEQTGGGIPASPTMDIFALGQICQWFVTGNIHRGTGRTPISRYITTSGKYDRVIDKCLSNNPSDRFQSIAEINDFLKQIEDESSIPNNNEILNKFSDVMSASFPRISDSVTLIQKKSDIERFLDNLSKVDFKSMLWWSNGSSAGNPFNLVHLRDDIWIMGYDETTIKAMWVYSDVFRYNDFALLHLGAMPHFDIYDTKSDYEQAALVDDKYYISRTEYDKGYAEIGGGIIKLSDHKVSIRNRKITDSYVFVSTFYNCIMQRKSDPFVEILIQSITDFGALGNDLETLIKHVKQFKHHDVEMAM